MCGCVHIGSESHLGAKFKGAKPGIARHSLVPSSDARITANRIISNMPDPDRLKLNKVLVKLAESEENKSDAALAILTEMEAHSILPDGNSYAMALQAMRRAGDKRFDLLLNEAQARNIAIPTSNEAAVVISAAPPSASSEARPHEMRRSSSVRIQEAGMGQEELAKLHAIFDVHDRSITGLVPLAKLEQLLFDAGYITSAVQRQSLMQKIGRKSGGSIAFVEFLEIKKKLNDGGSFGHFRDYFGV